MSPSSLSGWLNWLEKQHPKSIDMGLQRVKAVGSELGIFESLRAARDSGQLKVITVAGTNGKGTTVAACRALIQQSTRDAGKTCSIGVYTSPHLLKFNERIVINQQPCEDGEICDALEAVEQARQSLNAKREHSDTISPTTLTYFEYTTLAALYIFAQHNLEYWLLEVGLGGRLDAVNIIDPDIAVITQIGLDHQDFLGEDREAIAREKAGILRKGIPVVVSDPEPPDSLLSQIKQLGNSATYGTLQDQQELAEYQPSFHPMSWWAGLQVIERLGLCIEKGKLTRLINETKVTGRFTERIYQGRRVILDVAHNLESASYLAQKLAKAQGKTFAIFAALAGKPVGSIFAAMRGVIDAWALVELQDASRALPINELERQFMMFKNTSQKQTDPIERCENMKTALNWAVQQAAPDDRIVVFGSFYTVAEALALIEMTDSHTHPENHEQSI